MDCTKKVIVVRHAESIANLGLRSQNAKLIPLSKAGRLQAEKLAEILPKVELVVTSPYLRARETATPYLQKYPASVCEWWSSVREFTYLSGKKYDGTNHSERALPRQAFWDRSDSDYCDGDDAESFVDFVQRAERFLLTVRRHPSKSILVFSHEQFIQFLFFRYDFADYAKLRKTKVGLDTLMKQFKARLDVKKIPNAEPLDVSGWF